MGTSAISDDAAANPPRQSTQGTCTTAPTQPVRSMGTPGGGRGGSAPLVKQPPNQTGTSKGVGGGRPASLG